MRNWTRTLRPASYKGVGFFVEDEGGKSGRYIARHDFVKSEDHATEDMGRTAREYRVSAYLASDTADAALRDFVELCSEAGPGTLVLPMQGPVEVRCTACHVKARGDKLGYVALDLEFIEAGVEDDQLSPPAPIGDRLAASALDEMPDATGDMLNGRDDAARQGALSRRLDPVAAANADWAMPASADYQGTRTDAASRDEMFGRLFP